MEQGIEKLRATWTIRSVALVADQRRWLGGMIGREVTATVVAVDGSQTPVMLSSYSSWAKNYTIVALPNRDPAEIANATRVLSSVRLAPSAAAAPAASIVPGVLSWRCADGTIAFGNSALVCADRGGATRRDALAR